MYSYCFVGILQFATLGGNMKEFKSTGKFNHKGKLCFTVENDVHRSPNNGLRDFNDLYPYVIIDGVKYKTIGIESFCILTLSEGVGLSIMTDVPMEIKKEE